MDDNILPTRQADSFSTILSNAFKLINKSWEALSLNLGTFVLIYFLPMIIAFAAIFLVSGALSASQDDGGITAMAIIFAVVAGLGVGILFVFLSIATVIAQLASVQGKKISFKEVINQSQPFFWRFIGLGILCSLIIVAGLILFIIPGIVLGFWLILTSYIMVDKNIGVIETIKASISLTKRHWKVVLAYIVVQAVVQIPSAFIPPLGTIVSTALSIAYFCLPAIVYFRIANQNHTSEAPKTEVATA